MSPGSIGARLCRTALAAVAALWAGAGAAEKLPDKLEILDLLCAGEVAAMDCGSPFGAPPDGESTRL
jgi:hypothetical protein